jgi:hypothetical protein
MLLGLPDSDAASKSNEKKNIILVAILKVTDKIAGSGVGSGSVRGRIRSRFRIRTKMTRIHNTAFLDENQNERLHFKKSIFFGLKEKCPDVA